MAFLRAGQVAEVWLPAVLLSRWRQDGVQRRILLTSRGESQFIVSSSLGFSFARNTGRFVPPDEKNKRIPSRRKRKPNCHRLFPDMGAI